MTSPFSDRGMITDASKFFGRTAETQKIFNALAGPKPQSVSIIGERRIGRSSLLQHVLRSYPQHLPQPSLYRFAYLDLARDTCRNPHQFYAEVAQAFGANQGNTLSPQEFDDWLSSQNPQRTWRYIILLDEFNTLQQRRDTFDNDFYNGLRSRANAGEITYVLASHLFLHEIALANNFESTFFGIFTPVELNGFSENEARTSALRDIPKPLQPEDFKVIGRWVRNNNQGTYHPLKLNIAADLVWQAPRNPNFTQLKAQYEQHVAHTFGQAVHTARRWKRWLATVLHWSQIFAKGIHWITGEKPYLLLLLIIVVVLFIIGALTWDQLTLSFLSHTGVPTLTPTPSATPLPTPTP